MARQLNPSVVLGLDVGAARIGVAVGNVLARLPRPLAVIDHDRRIFAAIKDMAAQEGASQIVVGLPRNMDGQETKQSQDIRQFAEQLQGYIHIPITFADESLSSHRAEKLSHGYRSVSGGRHMDDIAACFILEEFFGKEINA